MSSFNNRLIVLAFCLLFFSSTSVTAQRQQVDPAWETGTIENQIDFLIKGSNNYQDYKVIKKASLFQLKSNILDSLSSVGQSLALSQSKVKEQNATITSLNSQMSGLQTDLDKTNAEKGSISFLGMQMNKGAYQGLMWAIIAGLCGLLALFVLRFKQSHSVTSQARKDLEDLQKDYEDHRKRSLEREQKAMRKLQDVLNQSGRGA